MEPTVIRGIVKANRNLAPQGTQAREAPTTHQEHKTSTHKQSTNFKALDTREAPTSKAQRLNDWKPNTIHCTRNTRQDKHPQATHKD